MLLANNPIRVLGDKICIAGPQLVVLTLPPDPVDLRYAPANNLEVGQRPPILVATCMLIFLADSTAPFRDNRRSAPSESLEYAACSVEGARLRVVCPGEFSLLDPLASLIVSLPPHMRSVYGRHQSWSDTRSDPQVSSHSLPPFHT